MARRLCYNADWRDSNICLAERINVKQNRWPTNSEQHHKLWKWLFILFFILDASVFCFARNMSEKELIVIKVNVAFAYVTSTFPTANIFLLLLLLCFAMHMLAELMLIQIKHTKRAEKWPAPVIGHVQIVLSLNLGYTNLCDKCVSKCY